MLSEENRLITTGCNHHKTPLEIRERIALTNAGCQRLQDELRADKDVSEAAILNTCNRLEIFVVTSNPDWLSRLGESLKTVEAFPVGDFLSHAYSHEGLEAVQHAYRVAAGLDSQMIGETQILGQMKTAYANAIQQQTVGPVLHRFFQKAFQAAKWARSETKIGTGQVSLGNVAVELAMRIFGRLTVSRTLVLGSGEAGRDVAKAFRSRGVSCMSIASRTHERAEALAHEVDGLIIPFNTWQETLPYVDIGIFATSSSSPLLDRKLLEEALGKRSRKPLFLIDLAVPRDIAPDVADLSNIYLYNLGDLAEIANENLRSREREVKTCLDELDQRARYMWENTRI